MESQIGVYFFVISKVRLFWYPLFCFGLGIPCFGTWGAIIRHIFKILDGNLKQFPHEMLQDYLCNIMYNMAHAVSKWTFAKAVLMLTLTSTKMQSAA